MKVAVKMQKHFHGNFSKIWMIDHADIETLKPPISRRPSFRCNFVEPTGQSIQRPLRPVINHLEAQIPRDAAHLRLDFRSQVGAERRAADPDTGLIIGFRARCQPDACGANQSGQSYFSPSGWWPGSLRARKIKRAAWRWRRRCGRPWPGLSPRRGRRRAG